MNILHPPNWPRPRGYSNGISAKGRIVVTGGIVGWDENENFVKQDIAGQAAQAFKNMGHEVCSVNSEDFADFLYLVLQSSIFRIEHNPPLPWFLMCV